MSPPLSDEQANRVERHTSLVRRLAYQLSRQVEVLPLEELESIGNEALVQAAMRYDPSLGASFKTFAYYRVRGAMIDAIRKHTPGRRKFKRALVQLEASQSLLAQAAEDQQARVASGERQTLEQRVEAARALVRRASLAIALSEPDRYTQDDAADLGPDLEQQLLDAESRAQLLALIGGLDAEQRKLIEALYAEGLTMKEIAIKQGLSVATVSRRHAKLLDLLSARARSSLLAARPR